MVGKAASRALLSILLTSYFLSACASSSSSAAVTAPAAGPVKTVVLVEAEGPNVELEAFLSRFLSELSDRAKFRVLDARLSGARVGALAAEPTGEAARAFQRTWPGDVYMGITVEKGYVKSHQQTINDRTPEGYAVQQVIVSYEVLASGSLNLADAQDGHVIATLKMTGSIGYTGDDPSAPEFPEQEAARDMATRAAKKLVTTLGR